jgi:hypothetical protein
MKTILSTGNKKVRWLLAVAGTLLLGALGSGIWQDILRPVVHISTRWVLDVASIGMKNYKNSVYEQIAADNHTLVAVYTQIIVLYFLLPVVMFSSLFAYSRLLKLRRLIRDYLGEDEPMNELSADALKQQAISDLKRTAVFSAALWIAAILCCAGIMTLIVSAARLAYVDSADTHYHQVLRLVSPYLDAHEILQVDSDFSQIGSREDYVKLLTNLEQPCRSHGRTVPQFDPW